MKKIILFAGLLLCGIAQAQLISATGNGDPITEGETFTFNTLTPQSISELDLVVTNISTEPINVKLRMNSVQNNSNGNNLQFCFGNQCYLSVNAGSMVPSNASGVTLQPNQSNEAQDHFWNNDQGDVVGSPVSYNMSFVRVDATGAVVETLLTFNYVYQPTMGTNDFAALQNLGITVNNTMVKDVLSLNSTQKGSMELYSVTGQLVKSVTLNGGAQSVDVSDLSTAVYVAKFVMGSQSSSIRIVKQ